MMHSLCTASGDYRSSKYLSPGSEPGPFVAFSTIGQMRTRPPTGKIKLRAGGASGGGSLTAGAGKRPKLAGGPPARLSAKADDRTACPTAEGTTADGVMVATDDISQLQYPRSTWLRASMEVADYLHLVRLSDCSQHDGRQTPTPNPADGRRRRRLDTPEAVKARPDSAVRPGGGGGQAPTVPAAGAAGAAAAGAWSNNVINVYRSSKLLMDADRLAVAAEAGYQVGCGLLHPAAASLKNDVLIGFPARLAQ